MPAYPTTANSMPPLVQDEEANLSWKVKKYPIHVFGISVLCLFADISVDCNSYCNIHSCNKYYPTFFFDINTAVNSSAHGTHVLHLLRVGKEG